MRTIEILNTSDPMSGSPRGFRAWLADLAERGLGTGFRIGIAAQLRVIAGTRCGGVVLCTVHSALPYVPWIQDGMSMNSRLILHTDSEDTATLARRQFSTDIRVAVHVQELSSFLADIEEHRFDMVVLDTGEIEKNGTGEIADRVGDQGLLVGVGDPGALGRLSRNLAATHFNCALGESGHGGAFARKGLQHRTSRRGGRRGRAGAAPQPGRSDP